MFEDIKKLFDDIYNFTAIGTVKEFIVERCRRKDIASFVVKLHYSHNIYGVDTKYCFKLLDKDKRLIGTIIFGRIAIANVWKKYAEKEEDIIELRRLVCINNTPKNTESYFIGAAIRWLKKNTKLKFIISYSDEEFGHSGVVYRASNFKHLGMTKPGLIYKFKDGKRMHDRSIRSCKTNNIFKNNIRSDVARGLATLEETRPKHIYLYQLR